MRRIRVLPLLLLSVMAASCTVDLTDTQARLLVGGTYRYTSSVAAYPTFTGTLLLSDGGAGEFGGTYMLPAQCSNDEDKTVDCTGRISGTVDEAGNIRFDFDSDRFHHSGRVLQDASLEGIWVYTQRRMTADSVFVEDQITGTFRATLVR